MKKEVTEEEKEVLELKRYIAGKRKKGFTDKHITKLLAKKGLDNDVIERLFPKEEKLEGLDYNKAGVVIGVVGLLVLPLLFGILAVIFGALAKGKGSKKNGALILGVIDIVWGIVSLVGGFSLFG